MSIVFKIRNPKSEIKNKNSEAEIGNPEYTTKRGEHPIGDDDIQASY